MTRNAFATNTDVMEDFGGNNFNRPTLFKHINHGKVCV